MNKCENRCDYCPGKKDSAGGLYANAKQLRSHVMNVHIQKDIDYGHITLTNAFASSKKKKASTVPKDLEDSDSPGQPAARKKSTGALMPFNAAESVLNNTHRALRLHENDRENFRNLVHAHLKETTDLDTLVNHPKASRRVLLTETVNDFLVTRAPWLWRPLIGSRKHLSQKEDLVVWGGADGGARNRVTGPIGSVDTIMVRQRRRHWTDHNPGLELTDQMMKVESDLGLWTLGYFMALIDLLANGEEIDGEEEASDEDALMAKILKEKNEA
ncbi:hypothetical protein CLAFUW4_07999 [Fulvia fulva]|uniref:Uncharacterized protein n=1 Tax=Passalora fulva TaxID=5499 RepID=A0A9Q8LDG6_PASFU|nr:uncharacterized protein CLAFUR5_08121 [Fulvia fulva]KAK4629009.1 hypothetical protein CLAFUR4_08004 [Fulvia fulva]KAK4630024.1 hypothetical protein CLAFUR0_08000 [Fulvia fulva]UJO15531.1 hypothetical protein CLAFUR5_08121 [Fulvia fulva]WPV12631.1 hypothetical protein CLAFUW4_07999 [Fulvia fulva]WPV27474.1 hypothetical protein CLAFUW7_07999 [Fulvia fulva]